MEDEGFVERSIVETEEEVARVREELWHSQLSFARGIPVPDAHLSQEATAFLFSIEERPP